MCGMHHSTSSSIRDKSVQQISVREWTDERLQGRYVTETYNTEELLVQWAIGISL